MFQVFEISPSLYVVELRKSYGDSSAYRQACLSLSLPLPPSPLSFRDDITHTRFAYVVIPAVVYKAIK
jgi:hypothetical protein